MVLYFIDIHCIFFKTEAWFQNGIVSFQQVLKENILETFWKRDSASFHKVPIPIPVPKQEADVRWSFRATYEYIQLLIISIINKECAYSVLRNNQNYQKIVIYPIKPIIHIANYIYLLCPTWKTYHRNPPRK